MTTPRIEEMQGRKIGEDKYTEHWSLDGSTYVQVPKWVIAQAHQAGVRDAMEAVDKAKAKIEEIEEPVASGCIYKSYVYEILDEALSALIQE